MPYGVLPNQQMSKIEQGGYVHCIAPEFKRKILPRFKKPQACTSNVIFAGKSKGCEGKIEVE